jgi:hypothetical protein
MNKSSLLLPAVLSASFGCSSAMQQKPATRSSFDVRTLAATEDKPAVAAHASAVQLMFRARMNPDVACIHGTVTEKPDGGSRAVVRTELHCDIYPVAEGVTTHVILSTNGGDPSHRGSLVISERVKTPDVACLYTELQMDTAADPQGNPKFKPAEILKPYNDYFCFPLKLPAGSRP